MVGRTGPYRVVQGLQWPADDTECAKVVFGMSGDMNIALPYVKERGLALQAGGNCGVWARFLSPLFGTVVTAEPDHLNFQCLAANTDEFTNVIRLQAAFGAVSSWSDLVRERGNCGAHYLANDGAAFPVLKIDDLSLPRLDYLCLDIEGMEFLAIQGGWQTVLAYRPVIQVEDKGLSSRYGVKKGAVETLLANLGYKVVARPHRDVILVPGG